MQYVKPNRRVPEGVDAQSWLGFEGRIARRRFTTLSTVIDAAVAAGDLVTARAAIDEARQLRPDAPELLELEMKVLAVAPPPADLRFWPRATGGVALLVVGASMVLGLESLRHVSKTTDGPEIALERLPVHAAVVSARGGAGAPAAPGALGEASALRAAGAPGAPGAPGAAADVSTPRLELVRLEEPPIDLARVEPVHVEPLRIEPRAVLERPDARSAPADNEPVVTNEAAVTAMAATRPGPAPEPEMRAIPAGAHAADRPVPAQPAQKIAEALPPPVPSYTPRPVVSPPVSTVGEDESRVADVLRRYARAYGELDASAARAIWPTVDQRALARAFESLRSQELSLQDCRIDVHGATANASCRGQAQYIGKVGSGEPRIEPRTWRFELRRDGDAWKIANAEARRPTS